MTSRTIGGLVAALATLSLLGAGCSLGAEEAAGEPAASSSQAAHRSAAAEKARHAYVDPCSLLDRSQRQSLAGNGIDSSYDVRLLPTAVEVNSCSISYQGSVTGALALNYGYATTSKLAFGKFLRSEKKYGGATVEEIDGVGDEAYLIHGSAREAWVRKGNQALFVWVASPAFDATAAAQVLADMLEKATPGMLEHPIHLPKACPPATNPRVVAVVGGKVTRAIGSRTRSGTACSYANAKRSLSLTTGGRTKKNIQKELEVADAFSNGLDSDRQTLHLVPNSTTRLAASETGPYAFTYMLGPPTVISASVDNTVHLGRSYDFADFDQGAFRALNEWWVRRQAAKLRK